MSVSCVLRQGESKLPREGRRRYILRLIIEYEDKLYEFRKFERMCDKGTCAFHPCRDSGRRTIDLKSFCPRFSKTKKEGGWKEIT